MDLLLSELWPRTGAKDLCRCGKPDLLRFPREFFIPYLLLSGRSLLKRVSVRYGSLGRWLHITGPEEDWQKFCVLL